MNKGFIPILATIMIGAIVGAVIILETPFSLLKKLSPTNFGTTITDISTATKFADFPAIYNTNNLALNNGKFELSDWYATTTAPQLTTLGTITTGTWNASTLTVAYGGTGSTTLSAYHVLIGNGTGNIGIVSGLGTSGQFLTSGGAGTAPTWTTSAINEAGDYVWTGTHSHSGNTYIKNLNASSTAANPLTLNGVAYNMPSSQGASSTALTNDGTGKLIWEMPSKLLYINESPSSITNTASTTVFSTTIPGGILGANNAIVVEIYSLGNVTNRFSAYSKTYFDFGYGGATTTIVVNYGGTPQVDIGGGGKISFIINGNGTTNSQKVAIDGLFSQYGFVAAVTAQVRFSETKTIAVNSAIAQNISLIARTDTFGTYGITFSKIIIYTLQR